MSVTIKKLPPQNWELYRDLRLDALQTDPLAFASSYEEEKKFSAQTWQSRIDNMLFALVDDNVVGMIGLIKNDMIATSHTGLIVSFWVKPMFRGRGIGKQLLLKVQKIATETHLYKLSLTVTTSQREAIKLYKKIGFESVGLLEKNLLKHGCYLDEYLMEWFVKGLS